MMIPPIVGVPAFSWWPSGPSSRMNWPNSRARRNAMNFGDRKMQMSSEAVPAMRTSPISGRPGSERLGDDLEADAARALDEHGVAGREQVRGRARRPRGRRDVVLRAALEGVADVGGERADGDEHVDAARRRERAAISAWKPASPGPSSSMSPSTATRRPGADAARSSSAARIDIGFAL